MQQTPARIFVLWHPEFATGAKLAQRIFNWFRTPDGHGIPVYYRSNPGPRTGDALPPLIPLHEATFNLLIILAEAEMVRDQLWRKWLTNLAEDKAVEKEYNRIGKRQPPPSTNPPMIYPVALHRTAYNLPGGIRKLNFISPLGRGDHQSDLNEDKLKALEYGIRKSLTEAFARLLVQSSQTSATPNPEEDPEQDIKIVLERARSEPPKIKVFISHAKSDGTDTAKGLRDYIYQETQLSAFFDENDIALGYKFEDVLEKAIASETAAMIAVNSDRYAGRPWCRREIQRFSRPRKSSSHNDIWVKPPVLVVQSMLGGYVSSAVPEFGNAPMVRWVDGDESLCIDTLLREAIFRAYHSKLASFIRDELDKRHPYPNRVFVNWPPDPLGLQNVVQDWEQQNKNLRSGKHGSSGKKLEVVYPGRGLSAIELKALEDRFPDITLRSFTEARPLA